MDIKLDNLLEGTLVVPYSDEEIERLEAVCTAVLDGDDFNDDTVADLALMVLTHTSDAQLKKMFEMPYQVQYEKELNIPRSVCEALAAYTVYKAIEKGDITYQLALLNCMIVMNGRWDHQSYPELFAQCVETAVVAVDGKSDADDVDDKAFLQMLFGEKEHLSGASLDGENLPAMKNLARDAWYFRTREYIEGEALKGYSTYERVFVGLSHIVDSMPWNFLNQRVLQQIRELAPRSNAKELTVAEIIEQVRPHYNRGMELNSQSSILLQLLADPEYGGKNWEFMKTTLSVRQFAVYLYYELILEKYFD